MVLLSAAFVGLFLATVQVNGQSARMALDVYYESLCPDSRNFLVNQLAPNWKSLSSFVDLRLIPFGKASFTANPDGGWSFRCQHGPSECSGNILHACGIKYSKDINQALDFTSCLMKVPTAGDRCAGLAGLDFAPVDACHKSLEGQNLVQAYGVETLSLQPKMTFVPWVIMDKAWDDSKQWNSLRNLGEIACQHVKSSPAVCLSS